MIRSLRMFGYLILLSLFFQSCYRWHNSQGGGQLNYTPEQRQIDPDDVLLPEGYDIKVVVDGLTFPTAAVEDDEGRLYVIESGYAYGEVFLPPKLLRVREDGSTTLIVEGEQNGPWTGITYHNQHFYIAEGGELKGGKILRVDMNGNMESLVENLPSLGDHHTNGPVIKDGYIYFGQGTATNSAVVGPDNAASGWLHRNPDFHDIPCKDIVLKGINYTSKNPLTEDPNDKVTTGPYMPFGESVTEGQIIEGKVPCTGAIMRIPLEGGAPELVSWGLRNPYGLSLSPSNELFVSENSYDVRGNRPVWGTGDVLWKIEEDTWYGWPDHNAGNKISYLKVPGEDAPKLVLAEYPQEPPQPVANLGVHSSSNGLDFSENPDFGFQGQVFIAQFGDMAPNVGKVWKPVGYKIVRVDVETGLVEDFALNKGKNNGPATWLKSGGLERPVSVNFSEDGQVLYIVDFGILTIERDGAKARERTGVIWKITKR